MEFTKHSFQVFIRKNNLRYTQQRELLIEAIFGNKGHFTADELYQNINRKYPHIGRATIYRTLKLLEEAELTSRIDFGDGHTRYEISLSKEHHDHLICERCSKSIEVVDAGIESMQNTLAGRHGFVLTGHRLYLFGICSDCQNK